MSVLFTIALATYEGDATWFCTNKIWKAIFTFEKDSKGLYITPAESVEINVHATTGWHHGTDTAFTGISYIGSRQPYSEMVKLFEGFKGKLLPFVKKAQETKEALTGPTKKTPEELKEEEEAKAVQEELRIQALLSIRYSYECKLSLIGI